MNDEDKSKEQLIQELRDLRQSFSFEALPEYIGHALSNSDGLTRERTKHLFTAGPGILYTCNTSGHYPATFISQNVKSRLGYEPWEFTDNPNHWIDNVHPDDLKSVLEELKRLYKREHLIHQYRFRHKDGSWRWMLDEHQVVRDSAGEPQEILGCWTDITLQKQAEEKLRESEKRYQVLTENSLLGIAVLKGVPPVFSYVNQKWTEIFGYTANEILSFDSEDIWKTVHPEDRPLVRQRNKDRLLGKHVIPNYEFRIIRKDGTTRWVEVFASKLPSDSEALSMAIYVDITERKEAEVALQESEERFRRLFQHHSAVKLVIDPETGDIIDANDAAVKFYGWFLDELKQMNILHINVLPPKIVMKETEKAVILDSSEVEYRHLRKDGTIRDVEVYGNTIETSGKSLLYAIVHDITDRKIAEEAVQDSEKRFRVAFMASPAALSISSLENGVCIDVNQTELDMFGYTREEVIGKNLLATNVWINPNDRHRIVSVISKNGEVRKQNVQLRRKDGRLITTSISATGLTLKGEKHILFVTEDITERKLADEKINSALQEKEVLLREIHHRVKNNMQVISSLLFLQASRVENDQGRQALLESQQRILAMAMTHEVLYSGQNLAAIDLSVYLRHLVDHLQRAYSNQAQVQVAFEADHVEIDINHAVPCSLILNELITNAFKHAFPYGRKGTVWIRLYLAHESEVVLELSDDGVGFPLDLDLSKPSSLGLRLIKGLLVKQLKGSMNMTTKGGTTFILRWPLTDCKGINK